MKTSFLGILLLLSLPLFSQKVAGDDAIFSKKYTYASLSKYQKTIFDEFIESEFPNGVDIKSTLDEKAWTRNKSRLAEALLYRNQQGDKENASIVLKWVFGLQVLDKNSKDYGVWRSSLNDTLKYDQNMREFIGTDLMVVHHKYKNLLSEDVVKGLESSLIVAANGALIRNVNPDYNNISIMSSVMMEYVGNVFHLEALKELGLKKAKQIFANYHVYNTLCEYNAPTYYGVDFVGLALWRELAFSKEIQEMGNILEKELWIEFATFYNANLKNVSGPFLRGSGLDMQKYNAITGIWIATAIDNEKIASIPRKKGGMYFECGFIVPILDLGVQMPKKALAQFKKFDAPHFISRDVPNYYEGDKLKKVTAMINKDWMMGGLWGNRKNSPLLKTGTIQWKTKNEDLNWLLVPGEGKTNVKVSETQMSIFLADKDAKEFSIYVFSKDINDQIFANTKWILPNMTLETNTTLVKKQVSKIEPEVYQSIIHDDDYQYARTIVFEIPANWDTAKPLIEITPKK